MPSASEIPNAPTTTPPPTTTPNPCGSDFKCATTSQCIKPFQVCDFTLNCYDGSDEINCGPCDFEKDQCGWTDNSQASFLTWRRRNGDYSSYGPQVDHVIILISSL